MALCWSIQRPTNSPVFVLWMLVVTVCGVESFSSKYYPPGPDTISSLLKLNKVEHNINRRSTNDEALKPLTSKVNTDIDSINQNKSTLLSELLNEAEDVGLKRKNLSYEHGDEEKSKYHKQQKVNFDFKNNRKIASNESNNEKQKPTSFGGQGGFKYNNLKKDLKLSPDINDPILKSNLSNSSLPNSYKLDNRKTLQLTEIERTTFTKAVVPGDMKMNETYVMSDQPAPIEDTVHNVTDIANEGSLGVFSDNTTSKSYDDSNITTSTGNTTMPISESWDIIVVSGIILGTLVFIGVVASGGYVIYRRRIWNKPQTLSDKCSNADSSGYIDDSTIRENSEEMYSLDNDSFLNSLEAMTIQNYWTDNVKHTKL